MFLLKIISMFSRILHWITMVSLFIMMIVIAAGVISRLFDSPMVGNVEMVQILQVIAIMCAFAYAQAEDRHISIGIITDRLSKRIQTVIVVFGYIITIAFCLIVGMIFWKEALENYRVTKETTLLLEVPIYILKFVCSIGFYSWGLETINRLVLLLMGKTQLKSQLEREMSA